MNIDNTSESPLGMRGIIPKWSPDGRWIAGARQTEISKGVFAFDVYVVPLDGTEAHPIFHSESYRRLFWLPDSRHLLLIDPDSQNDSPSTPLEIVSIEDGGGVRRSIELNAYTRILESSWQP
jgi:tricorn protease-like protein